MRGEHVVSVNKNRGSVALLGLRLVGHASTAVSRPPTPTDELHVAREQNPSKSGHLINYAMNMTYPKH